MPGLNGVGAKLAPDLVANQPTGRRSGPSISPAWGWRAERLRAARMSPLLVLVLQVWLAHVTTSATCESTWSRQPPEVQTDRMGTFRGIWLEPQGPSELPVAAFLGIRYASPASRQLRFMPPTAFQYSSKQLHNVQKPGPICTQRWPLPPNSLDSPLATTKERQQEPEKHRKLMEAHLRLMRRLRFGSNFDRSLAPLFRKLSGLEQSEDCLNLNLFANSEVLEGAKQAPVLVVLQGESADYGAGLAISARRLAAQNKLLVVTFNYRLNILGFPPRLGGAVRTNLGLMDQIAALHWVQEQAAHFGGQSSQVSLLGSRTGGSFVSLLMMSPLAKGLFQRAIVEDASALSPLVAPPSNSNLGPSVQFVRLLARLCDCPAYLSARRSANITNSDAEAKTDRLMVECLRQQPAEKLSSLRIPQSELVQLNASSGHIQLAGHLLAQHTGQDGPQWRTVDEHTIRRLFQEADASQRDLLADAPPTRWPVNELFDALHLASESASFRPAFEPQLDGSILPNEDPASHLLAKSHSPFSHCHLLMGLSQAELIPPEATPITRFQLDPVDQNIGARLHARLEAEGLTSGQAVELVRAFVRSFYKFHPQEISNSIIDRYLAAGRMHNSTNSHGLPYHASHLVVRLLLEAFRDSLTNVPVLRQTLVHSASQLSHLVQNFIELQFKQRLAYDTDSDLDRGQLLVAFIDFVKKSQQDEQPVFANQFDEENKRTYLYQLKPDELLKMIERMVNQLSNQQALLNSKTCWWKIRDRLQILADEFGPNGTRSLHLSLDCLLHLEDTADVLGQQNSGFVSNFSLADSFIESVCSRFGKVITQFATSTRLGVLDSKLDQHDMAQDFLEGVERHELTCSESRLKTDINCEEDLQRLTLRLLTSSNSETIIRMACKASSVIFIPNQIHHESSPETWEAFSLFRQQVATLPGPHLFSNEPWKVQQLEGSPLIEKASFWSNYVTALNCNRTQPVIPSSLMQMTPEESSKVNLSSLVTVNLVASCLPGRAKSSLDLLNQLLDLARQRAKIELRQWRSGRPDAGVANVSHSGQHSTATGAASLSGELEETRVDFQRTIAPAVGPELGRRGAESVVPQLAPILVCTLIVCAGLLASSWVLAKRKNQRRDDLNHRLGEAGCQPTEASPDSDSSAVSLEKGRPFIEPQESADPSVGRESIEPVAPGLTFSSGSFEGAGPPALSRPLDSSYTGYLAASPLSTACELHSNLVQTGQKRQSADISRQPILGPVLFVDESPLYIEQLPVGTCSDHLPRRSVSFVQLPTVGGSDGGALRYNKQQTQKRVKIREGPAGATMDRRLNRSQWKYTADCPIHQNHRGRSSNSTRRLHEDGQSTEVAPSPASYFVPHQRAFLHHQHQMASEQFD